MGPSTFKLKHGYNPAKYHFEKNLIHKGIEQSESETSRKPSSQFRCDICKIETSNQNGLDQHFIGKNHQKNMAKLGLDYEPGKSPFRCEICDVEASNQVGLDQHLAGKAHRKQLEDM